MNVLNAWFSAILQDFRGTPVGRARVRLLDLDPGRLEAHADEVPDSASWIDPTDPTRHRLLLVVDENITSLDQTMGEGKVAVEIASYLQDFVMDGIGTPWPEITVKGRPVVLEPRLSPTGQPRWEGNDGVWCPFGELGRHRAN